MNRSEPPIPEDDDGPLRNERIDIQRKVSLKFKEFQGFITEFSENISTGGMFIRTTSPQDAGSIFDFEFTLGDDYTLIHGLGEVVWVREEDEGFDRPAGMGVRFLSLDPESRELIDRIVAERLERQQAEESVGHAPGEWGMGGGEAPAPPPVPSPDGPPLSPLSPSPSSSPAAADDEGTALADIAASVTARAAAPDTDPEPDGRPVRRATGPSPYARSYRATATETGRWSKLTGRPLLLVLLVVVLLAAVAAGLFMLFPDAAMELLLGGGGGGGGAEQVATRPTEEAAAPGSGPAGAATATEGVPTGAPATAPPGDEPTPDGVQEAGGDPVAGGRAAAENRTDGGEDPPAEPAGADAESAAEQAEARVDPRVVRRDRTPGLVPEPTAEDTSQRRRGRPGSESASGEAVQAPLPPVPEDEPFTRVRNITWRQLDGQLLITIHLDGAVREWDYSLVRIGVPPPRQLVRIQGISEPFPRRSIPVAAPLVDRVRTGFHPGGGEPELHVVLDLEDGEVVLERSEAGDGEIRLYLTREP